jgi:hypothetical protein
MFIDTNGKVVIDDKYICQFMAKQANESFFATCESILKSICLACEQNLSNESQNDIINQRLNAFKGELIDCIGSQKVDIMSKLNNLPIISNKVDNILTRKVDTSEIMSTIKTMNEHNMLNISSKLEQIPIISNKVDDVNNKIDMSKVIETSVTHHNDSLVQAINTMSNKIDTFSVLRNTTRFKGEEGEKGIINILESRLHIRDGYSIEDVKSIPRNCDILIKRTGFPNIRIESKAHGRESKGNVRIEEVKKFESDLLDLNNHGIFISLYSGICGKGTFEIELLPTKKFAVYLANNNYDGDIITEVVRLIYKLDKFISASDSDDIKISTESMMRVKSYITDFNRKIEELKTLNRNSMRILNEITLDIIEKTLTCGHHENNQTQASTTSLICEKCHQVCLSKAGFTLHKKKCQVSGNGSENVTQSLHVNK